MKKLLVVMCVWISLLSWNVSRAAEALLPTPDLEHLQHTKALDLTSALRSGDQGRAPTNRGLATNGSPQPGASALFREVPSISGQYSVGGKTLLPFIAAGFNGGYTERERAISPNTSGLSDGLRPQWSQFGQGFAPNEFQMGLRIPF